MNAALANAVMTDMTPETLGAAKQDLSAWENLPREKRFPIVKKQAEDVIRDRSLSSHQAADRIMYNAYEFELLNWVDSAAKLYSQDSSLSFPDALRAVTTDTGPPTKVSADQCKALTQS